MLAIGIAHALSGCNYASLPVDGRLACLLVRDNDVSVRVFYRCQQDLVGYFVRPVSDI